MKFYGDGGEYGFQGKRSAIEDVCRMFLRRPLTLREQWKVDEFAEKIFSREETLLETVRLRELVNRNEYAKH